MRCRVLLLVVAVVQSGFCGSIIADESTGPSESRQWFGAGAQPSEGRQPMGMAHQPPMTSKIDIGDVPYTLPFSFPSSTEIRRAIPDGTVRPRNADIQCELLTYTVDDAKCYPIVGCARLAKVHFKCTGTSGEGIQLVYIVHTHLIPAK